jgi:L-fuculose-phosphate aldolase
MCAAIAGRSACLLANHGMIVHAASPRQALTAALRLETLCRQYLLARSAGTPRLLTPDEMDAAMRRFETYAAGKG